MNKLKKIVLVFVLVSALLSTAVFFVPASAEVGVVQTELVGYLSNRGLDTRSWRVIGLDYQNPQPLNLEPNTAYVLNNMPFYTDEYGNIPHFTEFYAWDKKLAVVEGDVSPYYKILEYYPDYMTWLDFDRPTTTIGIYRLYGDVSAYSQGYLNGFDVGYNHGLDVGQATGYQSGYNQGYAEGERFGYSSGYNDGLDTADTGNWRSLLTAVVEAPLSVLYGVLDFEILGFDLKNAFGAILVLCVVVIVVKAVV